MLESLQRQKDKKILNFKGFFKDFLITIADILKVKETQMRNILKLGLISAVTAIALAQTPATAAQGMDEDVLAIATRGALSDSMQGFRKLADDEARQVRAGINITQWYGFQHRDYYGMPQQLTIYYEINFERGEEASGYARIGNSSSTKSNYAQFMVENRPVNGATLHFKINKFAGSQETVQLIRYNHSTRQEYVYGNTNTPFYQMLKQQLEVGARNMFIGERQKFFGR